MIIDVLHRLHYSYEGVVGLNPHTLYLYPKLYPHQQLIEYTLTIDPYPSKIIKNVDLEGNIQQVVYFQPETTNHLHVEMQMRIQSSPFNVLDFVLFPFATQRLPFQYPSQIVKYLTPYFTAAYTNPYVEQFARRIATSAQWETVPFLLELTRTIQKEFRYEKREIGHARSPEETLRLKTGTCRDYSRLFTAACASLGIAARFVSGYLFGNTLQEHELHSWAEVYLPGAGWRGFDPTEGMPMTHHHISLGASGEYNELAPVMGTFNGLGNSCLSTLVSLNEVT